VRAHGEQEQRMPIERKETIDGLAPIVGSAISATASGSRTIFLSGQVGTLPDGTVAGADLKSQAAQALRNIIVALTANDATTADIAKIVFYIVDWTPEKLGPLFEAAIEVLGDDMVVTASTLVGVAALFEPEWLIEIDATAVVG
jgi:enamine deaminase RidA (YjgF/YER057c/UK114 family)